MTARYAFDSWISLAEKNPTFDFVFSNFCFQCAAGLTCFQRSKTEVVPGCIGNGADYPGRDFCIAKPVEAPGLLPLKDGSRHPLEECEGDCDDNGDVSGSF